MFTGSKLLYVSIICNAVVDNSPDRVLANFESAEYLVLSVDPLTESMPLNYQHPFLWYFSII